MGIFGSILGGIGGFILTGGNPAGAIAGASIGGNIGTAVGGGKKAKTSTAIADLANPRIPNIDTPGISTRLSDGRLTLTSSPQVTGALDTFASASSDAAAGFGEIRALVTPGFGRLSETTTDLFARARQRIAANRKKSIGDLRENLNRRRLLGSSFADDSINRQIRVSDDALRDLVATENQVLAGNFLQELDLQTTLIREEAQVRINGAVQTLNQLNFESSIAAELATAFNSTISELAAFQADLLAQGSRARGAFFEPLVNPILEAGSKALIKKLGIG